jgi:hypothetical protein
MQMMIVYEMDEATPCVQSVEKVTKIVMDGALLSHVKALALRAQNDLMGAWVVTEGSEIVMIETRKKGLQEASIRFREIRMEIKSKKGDQDGMGLAEGGMNLHGSKTATMFRQFREIERAMEINLWTEVEDGEKRSVKIRPETVVVTEAMTGEIADGTRTDARSVTPNGWMNQRRKRNRPILKRTSKSGKRG